MTCSVVRKLERHGPLASADLRVLLDFCSGAQLLPAGANIHAQGQAPDRFHAVIDGWACRYRLLPNGQRQILGLLLPGDFSDIRKISLDRVDYAVATLTPALVLTIPYERLNKVLDQHPAIVRAAARARLIDERIIETWMTNLGRMDAQRRTAHLLCELSERLEAVGYKAGTLPLTQDELADTLGMTSVHVNRTIKQLRESGALSSESKRLMIADRRRLSELAGFDHAYLT